jgi:hypothetical protein
MDSIIDQARLMDLTKIRQKAALRKALRRAGIPFKECAGVIFTTQGALDASMVGRGKKNETKGPNFEHLAAKSSG